VPPLVRPHPRTIALPLMLDDKVFMRCASAGSLPQRRGRRLGSLPRLGALTPLFCTSWPPGCPPDPAHLLVTDVWTKTLSVLPPRRGRAVLSPSLRVRAYKRDLSPLHVVHAPCTSMVGKSLPHSSVLCLMWPSWAAFLIASPSLCTGRGAPP
jgi:hypothetical protein